MLESAIVDDYVYWECVKSRCRVDEDVLGKGRSCWWLVIESGLGEEVVEGGGATLYGTGAIGGVINIVTSARNRRDTIAKASIVPKA